MTNIILNTPLLFEVSRDILEDRFDPFYYHPEYISIIKKLRECHYELRFLGDIVDVENLVVAFKP